MFGYVKPDKENLLVKDLALYKAVYCGLCSVIKKEVSFILPFTLSYDFVFLVMVRAAIQNEKICISKGRCKYNPLKKCAFAICNKETLYTAQSSLILTTLKIEDDINDKDTPWYKRISEKIFYCYLRSKTQKLLKSEPHMKRLIESIRDGLKQLASLESSESANLDEACEIFGNIMSEIASFELQGNEKVIGEEIGSAIGRYIYLVDAIDDLKRDSKSGAYNPIIAKYGSYTEAKNKICELDIALAMFAKRAMLAIELLQECEYTRIIKNIISMGLGAEAYKIMTGNGDKND